MFSSNNCFCYFLLAQQNNGVYTVGDFMTKKEALYVVKPSTTVDEGALLD
jgi:hypothetical protein